MPRTLLPGQRCRIHVLDVDSGEDRIVHESADVLYEAPNWLPGTETLLVNGDGHLHLLDFELGDAAPRRLEARDLPPVNNDHVLAPDGEHVYASADDGRIHRVPLAGGRAVPVTEDDGKRHFLHGVSPDGASLAVVTVERRADGAWPAANIALYPVAGGAPTVLTADEHPDDGAEFTPDGAFLLLNSERGGTVPGHAQLFRMRPDGTDLVQLTHDERVNWFPHPSPDGSRIAYVSFPPGTLGHPADHEVILRLCAPDGSGGRDLVTLHGGQGTMNVNSWASDSRRLAYVDYPLGD